MKLIDYTRVDFQAEFHIPVVVAFYFSLMERKLGFIEVSNIIIESIAPDGYKAFITDNLRDKLK